MPQENESGSPRPKYERPASPSTASAMISTELAHTIGITLGRMWRRMIQRCEAPCERARSTNCRSRSESTCARTMRVVPAQPVIASTITMMPVLPPGIWSRVVLQERRHEHGERDERDHEEPVVEERQRAVDPAAEVAGADADDRPEHDRGEARHDARR